MIGERTGGAFSGTGVEAGLGSAKPAEAVRDTRACTGARRPGRGANHVRGTPGHAVTGRRSGFFSSRGPPPEPATAARGGLPAPGVPGDRPVNGAGRPGVVIRRGHRGRPAGAVCRPPRARTR